MEIREQKKILVCLLVVVSVVAGIPWEIDNKKVSKINIIKTREIKK